MKSAIASLLLLSKQSAASGSTWDYHSPDHWVDTYSMCDNEDQSPIDIITDDAVHDTSVCVSDFEWNVDFTKQTFKISNNAHTIVLQPVEATTIDPDYDLDNTLHDSSGTEYITLSGNDNTIATFPNYFQPTDSEHDSFCLDSMHFHWGLADDTGSEHTVDGHQYALEVHFVHYSCQHSGLSATVNQFPLEANVTYAEEHGEDAHQLGVVGIFFDVVEGETNPAFEAIFEQLTNINLPADVNSTDSFIVTDLDLSEMIPEDLSSGGYYAYEGSLTTPPCTDIVRWHVMNSRGWIGESQMELFRELFSETDVQIAPNYRPVQGNVNTVYACMEEDDEEEDDAAVRAIVWSIAVVSIITPFVMGIVCCYQTRKERVTPETASDKK